jgi:hypothetical protein
MRDEMATRDELKPTKGNILCAFEGLEGHFAFYASR